MDQLTYIGKMAYYCLFVAGMYFMATRSFVLTGKSRVNAYDTRIQLIPGVILCAILGHYSVICGHKPYLSDRLNYAIRFSDDSYLNWTKSNSTGLYYFEKFLHYFTYNPDMLFFSISFFVLAITLIAYNKYDRDQINPFALVFMGFSSYIYRSFMLLKQAPAMALMALAFVFYLKDKKKWMIVLILLAISFHESAWIALPVFLFLQFYERKPLRPLIIIGLAVSVLFFQQISRIGITLLNFIPGISAQVSTYTDDSGGISVSMNLMTVLKGVPYYFALAYAWLQKNSLRERVAFFDKYILLLFFVSVTFLMSAYMYWMWRLGSFFYFPVFAFASKVFECIEEKRERMIFALGTCGSSALLTLYAFYEYYFHFGGF